MISISWNPGQALSALEALQDPKLGALVAKAAAESYADSILDYIAEGKSFKTKTGQLEQSIGWRPDGGNGAVVYAQAQTALWIEQGTGLYGPYAKRYIIKPKPGGGRKALRLPIAGGGYLFRKLINHPGMKARPFFFADLDARKEKSLANAQGVLARRLAGMA